MAPLIKILLIIISIYFIGKLFFRIIFPAILRWYIKSKINENQFDRNINNEKRKKKEEGKVDIKHIPDNDIKKSNKKNDGDYIDYEEL